MKPPPWPGIRLELDRSAAEVAPWLLGAGAALLFLALLGWAVTRQQTAPVLLSRGAWQILQSQRRTAREAGRMDRDLHMLEAWSVAPQPDPVRSIWMAQRLYSRHRQGTAASAAARQALVKAGETAAAVASGARQPAALAADLAETRRLLRLLQPD